jgi:hypothetical protein
MIILRCMKKHGFQPAPAGSQTRRAGAERAAQKNAFPFAFQNAAQLRELCQRNGLSVAALMMKNELQVHSQAALHDYFAYVWAIMQQAVHRGLHTEGLLPGSYQVPRRACSLYKLLAMKPSANDFLTNLNWVNAFAIAVSEENAAGGRVVTAPTNGAAVSSLRSSVGTISLSVSWITHRLSAFPHRWRHRATVQTKRVYFRF